MSLALVSIVVFLFAGEAVAQTECGTYFSQSRIVGGNKTGYYKYPWHAITLRFGSPVCGGTLITQKHILTAAHCYDGYIGIPNRQKFRYRLGVYNSCKDEPTATEYSASAVTIHPSYNITTILIENDIAIVTLSTAATRYIPVCLPPTVSYSARTGLVMGYGITNSGIPCELNEAEVTIFTRQEALATNQPVATMAGIFAARNINESRVHICRGDSGGPLVVMDQGKYTILGITSFGFGCGLRNFPDFFTNVSYYSQFINNVTQSS